MIKPVSIDTHCAKCKELQSQLDAAETRLVRIREICSLSVACSVESSLRDLIHHIAREAGEEECDVDKQELTEEERIAGQHAYPVETGAPLRAPDNLVEVYEGDDLEPNTPITAPDRRRCLECGKPLRGDEMGGDRHYECL